jgi:NAD-dependent dihydropyrimidine dehydrogenase PreA subunit
VGQLGVAYAEAVTYIIAAPCVDVKDRSCVDACPVDCIHEAERILVIDAEECIDCGACEPECPVEAIFPEDALPDRWEPFVRINYAFNEGIDVVNRLVGGWDGDDAGNAGVREPRRPSPLAPDEGETLDPPTQDRDGDT